MKRGRIARSDIRGLSAVITTLIIILLVLVAIGIIWVVIRGVIEGGVGTIDLSTKCLAVDVRATAASCTPVDDGATPPVVIDYTCEVTLKRGSGGDPIDGIRLVFSDGTDSNTVSPDQAALDPLQQRTDTVDSGLLAAPTSLEVAVIINDEAGQPQICPTTTTFDI